MGAGQAWDGVRWTQDRCWKGARQALMGMGQEHGTDVGWCGMAAGWVQDGHETDAKLA